MNPIFMTLLLVGGWSYFAYSARRRWRLMMVGVAENRWDNFPKRLQLTITYALAQMRMRRYPLAGIAHMLIFAGFGVLLLRTLILWGRGYDESFNFWIFGTENGLGKIYSLFKDVFAVLVILGTLVFVYFRAVKKLGRMTLSTEGLVILGIILVMMFADIFYDGASIALQNRQGAPRITLAPHLHQKNIGAAIPREQFFVQLPDGTTIPVKDNNEQIEKPSSVIDANKVVNFSPEPDSPLRQTRELVFVAYEPAGSLAAMCVQNLSDGMLNCVKHAGFWIHSALVLIFLNLLPYSKHFHVITAIPNVYAQDLHPPGRLPNLEDIEGKLEREETLGIKRINQFSWKAILDFYTCTECGRCSEACPATQTGKKLSPKHFTLDLRDFLYKHENALVAEKAKGNGNGESTEDVAEHNIDLVGSVIDPEVLWACTSCRACEQECPVFITYVDKIVDMRRYLVQERGEFPNELQTAFRGLESSANPWGFPVADRANWADGLGVKTLAEHPDAEVIFWVGCAPSYDDRAKKVSRATAQLLQKAGVDFAILGQEEQCTGDPARRAGNEYLFQMFANHNVETLNNYNAAKKKIVTTCPHCFNTLLNEYPDFGGKYEVIHHTTFLAELIQQGKLKPTKPINKKVAYHDSCYLGRYNEVYDAPREALRSIPGLTVLEPEQTRDRGMCCGAGGAQMFKEEESGDERVNVVRTQQLLDTQPDAISSACPFCMRMLTDGLADKSREEVPQLDIAELLLESVGDEQDS